jgi:DNA-binding transcriptional ArsR family regulator
MSEDSLWDDGPDGLDTTTKPARAQLQARERFIGCPLAWLKAVYPAVWGKNQLTVALALYRLRTIKKSRTVSMSNMDLLAELGIDRRTKYRTLKRLAAAGIITIERVNKRALTVTFVQKAKGR